MEPLEGQDTGQEVDNTQGDQIEGSESTGEVSINPAWNDALSVIPTELHSQVTPYFQKWDQNYQSGIQKVHSQYESFKPYVEQGLSSEQINYALSIMDAIENQPQEVLTALQAYMGLDEEQGQEDQPTDFDDDTPEYLKDPEITRMREMVDTMAELLVQQRQQEVDAQEDTRLESELAKATETHGEFNEEWVIRAMLADENLSVDDAVKQFKALETSILQKQRQPGPKILGAGGSVPSQALDPKKLGPQEKRALMVQMLQQNAQQNQ
jgi:hypothetical protein